MTTRTNGERVDAGEPICEMFAAMMDLHQALGAEPVGGRVWTVDVDKRWRMTVNGNHDTMNVGGVDVPPFGVYVEYNGWPAGVFDMFGGVVAAGEAANEDALIAATQAAAAEARRG